MKIGKLIGKTKEVIFLLKNKNIYAIQITSLKIKQEIYIGKIGVAKIANNFIIATLLLYGFTFNAQKQG